MSDTFKMSFIIYMKKRKKVIFTYVQKRRRMEGGDIMIFFFYNPGIVSTLPAAVEGVPGVSDGVTTSSGTRFGSFMI